ncbi:hypothetical protein EYF80_014606 [Liparis tanakae]|uniref:Uncharacterized protein n=1 Tax=Liparis tanakae TaxID=230148 RepID=A0A4Z2IAY2_9TELE|nr:hypothetical protein EYF80_014606 [Liparis tanakae]
MRLPNEAWRSACRLWEPGPWSDPGTVDKQEDVYNSSACSGSLPQCQIRSELFMNIQPMAERSRRLLSRRFGGARGLPGHMPSRRGKKWRWKRDGISESRQTGRGSRADLSTASHRCVCFNDDEQRSTKELLSSGSKDKCSTPCGPDGKSTCLSAVHGTRSTLCHLRRTPVEKEFASGGWGERGRRAEGGEEVSSFPPPKIPSALLHLLQLHLKVITRPAVSKQASYGVSIVGLRRGARGALLHLFGEERPEQTRLMKS